MQDGAMPCKCAHASAAFALEKKTTRCCSTSPTRRTDALMLVLDLASTRRSNGCRTRLASQRPSSFVIATSRRGPHLSLLGELQRVVDLDPKVPDGPFELRVPERRLNGSEIPGPRVDQGRL